MPSELCKQFEALTKKRDLPAAIHEFGVAAWFLEEYKEHLPPFLRMA